MSGRKEEDIALREEARLLKTIQKKKPKGKEKSEDPAPTREGDAGKRKEEKTEGRWESKEMRRESKELRRDSKEERKWGASKPQKEQKETKEDKKWGVSRLSRSFTTLFSPAKAESKRKKSPKKPLRPIENLPPVNGNGLLEENGRTSEKNEIIYRTISEGDIKTMHTLSQSQSIPQGTKSEIVDIRNRAATSKLHPPIHQLAAAKFPKEENSSSYENRKIIQSSISLPSSSSAKYVQPVEEVDVDREITKIMAQLSEPEKEENGTECGNGIFDQEDVTETKKQQLNCNCPVAVCSSSPSVVCQSLVQEYRAKMTESKNRDKSITPTIPNGNYNTSVHSQNPNEAEVVDAKDQAGGKFEGQFDSIGRIAREVENIIKTSQQEEGVNRAESVDSEHWKDNFDSIGRIAKEIESLMKSNQEEGLNSKDSVDSDSLKGKFDSIGRIAKEVENFIKSNQEEGRAQEIDVNILTKEVHKLLQDLSTKDMKTVKLQPNGQDECAQSTASQVGSEKIEEESEEQDGEDPRKMDAFNEDDLFFLQTMANYRNLMNGTRDIAEQPTKDIYGGSKQDEQTLFSRKTTEDPPVMQEIIKKKGKDTQPVTLAIIYRDWDGTAKDVAVAGSFTSWRPVPMHRSESKGSRVENGRQLWTASFSLPPSTYYYKFIVNGEWVTVNSAPTVMDENGNENHLLKLSRTRTANFSLPF